MGAAAAIPIGMQVAGGAFSAVQADQEGRMASDYYGYLGKTSKLNAGLARAAGKADADEIGYAAAQQERKLHEGIRGALGTQRAALVGGAGVGSKTAEQIASDTLRKGSLDEEALRYNAEMKRKAALIGAEGKALGFEQEAEGYRLSGANARSSANMNKYATILGTGRAVASTWYAGSNFGAGGRY